jgi:alpha-tubulin suppressor-like RCC1 family protein
VEGPERSTSPLAAAGIEHAVGLAAGDRHTCAIVADGAVVCWGRNDLRQLGASKLRQSARSVSVALGPAVELAAARGHTCARLADGTVWCWGQNKDDQLGVQAPPRQTTSAPVRVPGIEAAVSIAAGSEHSCAAVSDGRLFCWGDNHYGQLGHGVQLHNSLPPQPVPIRGEVAQVVAGARHSCARLRDGTAACWGDNIEGQVGNGGTTPALTPVPVTTVDPDGTMGALANIVLLSAGWHHTCALSATRKVVCWGSNVSGQLGQVEGVRALRATPSGFAEVSVMAAGGQHTCVMRTDQVVSCVGREDAGTGSE